MNDDRALVERDPWPVDRYVPGGTDRPEGHAPALDFPTFVRILREWKWLILGLTAAGLALAILYTLLSTPLYRASVTLEVNPPTVEVMDEQSEQNAAPNMWELVATQVGLLESRSVAERAAQEANLASNPDVVDQSLNPATRLKVATSVVTGGLEVIPPKEGQLIRFNYVSESPQLAASVANAVAAAFIQSTLQRRYEASTYARNFLQRQIQRIRADLEQSERKLVAYAQQQGIINTGSGEEGAPAGDAASPQGQSLVALNQALAEATARRVAAEGAYRQARATGATSEVTESTQALRQSRAALQAEYQQKRAFMKPDHPEMVSLQSRIEELGRQIAQESATASSGRSNTLLAEYRAALSAERALQARVQQLKGAVLDLRGRSIQYAILQRDVDTNRALYDALLQRYKQIGVAGGVGTAPVSIVDMAEVPSGPFSPNLMLNVLLGLLGGLLAGILAAVGLEFVNDTIKTRADVRSKLGLACLGAIPKRADRVALLDEIQDPTSAVSDAYSALVASLRFATDRGMPKTLLVTSTRASEGKSYTAFAIAQNLARRGSSVLVIDSDLRKPAFKGSSDKQGLTKLLTSAEPVGSHVSPTEIENLWLLASGPVPPNPADLIASSRFERIVREAGEHFDFIVVDAPPVLGMADAPLLASICHDVLLVVESGKTRRAGAVEAINSLRATGAHILGATLTKATEQTATYGYGYGYGHRYGSAAINEKRTRIDLIEHQGNA